MFQRNPKPILTIVQFSDEFETDGRSFYPGDDPYFTAVDLWYGVTQDLEVCLSHTELKDALTNHCSGMILMPSLPRMGR